MERSNHHTHTAQSQLRAHLPAMRTSFVGRDRDIDEVKHMLTVTRLVTLVGAAGNGKTRLARQVVDHVRGNYPDGVYWIELAPLEDSQLVVHAVCDALQIALQPHMPLIETLQEALRAKHMLMVLDNCEHHLQACQSLVNELLDGTSVNILTTSREALKVLGEQRYPVAPMSFPSVHLSPDEMMQFDAVRLFIERAQAVVPQFALTPQNSLAIVNICSRLDGIPLALELASARLNVLTVEQIASRLDDRFALLTAAPHMTQSPHPTLQAAIEWSYMLLSPPEQALLRRMSVFAGGCSLEAAEVVCAGEGIDRRAILTHIGSVADKSLLVADTLHGGEARYRMLETVRAYAHDRLVEEGEHLALQARHLQWCIDLAENAAPKLRSVDQHLWLDKLEIEQDNTRAALAWAIEQRHIKEGLRIAVAMYQFWVTRGDLHEGLLWFKRLLDLLDERLPLFTHVNALTHGAWIAMFMADAETATHWSASAIRLCEASGDEGASLMSLALAGASGAARAGGDMRTALAMSEQSYKLERGRGIASSLMTGMRLYSMAHSSIVLGDYAPAHSYLEQALRFAHEKEDGWRVGITLAAIGDLARCEGRFADAVPVYTDSLAQFQKIGAVREMPNIDRGLGYTWLRLENHRHAQALFERSLEAQRTLKNRLGILQALLGFGALAAAIGYASTSAQLHGFVLGSRDWPPILPDPGDTADRADYTYFLAQVRAVLGEADFIAAANDGRALSLDQAVEIARHLRLPLTGPSVTDAQPPADGLSPREREVAALIGRGLSNGEIAETLVLSKRTVENHISGIFSKLGLTSRAQVVRWALQNGLNNPPSA
jgi:predicted ATPase/DNA-binding CsgD family transcriptional regulator